MTITAPFGLEKIEHIGLAVKDLEAAIQTYSTLFGAGPYKEELVPSQGVKTVFFKMGESKIELLAATNASSPIATFIEKNGPGMHHIAYAVKDIVACMEHFKKQGFRILSQAPIAGADAKKVIFLHPKDTHGCLIELCEDV